MNMHVGIVKKFKENLLGLGETTSYHLGWRPLKCFFIKYSKSTIKTKVCAVGQ